MRRFEFKEGVSNKFWEIEQSGGDLNIRFGKIGTAGQSQTKNLTDASAAAAALTKLVKEKTGKGYVETTVAAGASIGASAVRQAKVAEPAPEAIEAPPPSSPSPPPAAVPAPPQHVFPEGVAPWMAQGEPLDLPDNLRAQALSSRRYPHPIQRKDVQGCWNAFVKSTKKHKLDAQACDPMFRNAVGEAERRLASGQYDGSLESDGILLALAAVSGADDYGYISANFADFLVLHKGLPYALDVLLYAETLGIVTNYIHYQQPLNISFQQSIEEPLALGNSGIFAPDEVRLRDYLALADQDTYDACAAKIRAAVPGMSPWRLPLLGFLVPDLHAFSDELALMMVGDHSHDSAYYLYPSARSEAALRHIRQIPPGDSVQYSVLGNEAYIATVFREHGLGAIELLELALQHDRVANYFVNVGTPQAIAALSRIATGSKTALARLAAAVQRWPLAAIAALSELAVSNSKDSGLYLSSISSVLDAHLDALPALKPWISAAAYQVLERLAAQRQAPAEVADAADLPPVLASAPWLAARKRAVAPLELAVQPLAPTHALDDRAREDKLQLHHWDAKELADGQADTRAMAVALGVGRYVSHGNSAEPFVTRTAEAIRNGDTDALIQCWRDYKASGSSYYTRFGGIIAAHLPGAMGLTAWNALAGEDGSRADYALAKFGLAALPGLVVSVKQRPATDLAIAMPVGAVELAPPIARAYLKLKTARNDARAWLLAHPAHAARGLIPAALGKPGEARDCAASALRMLASQGHEAMLLDVAAAYERPDVSVAMQAMLNEDPLERFPSKIGKAPDFWQAAAWSRPVLASNGKALPDAALDHIGTMLRFPTAEGVYPGLQQVKDACEPQSLSDFMWDCFNAWIFAGSPSKESWALSGLGLLGNDDTARKLTPFLRAWPGEAQHARAVSGLDVLANIGTDTALMLLNGIAQKVKFKGLQDRAREKIKQIAEARDLTTEELEDRLAPDLGLDQHGTLLLDFGERKFRVGFDEALKPYVRDEAGARLPDLPKPKKTDDATLSAAAVERFKLLKKDARTIAAQQVLRLEVAMCAQRRWTPEVFRTFLSSHPLVRHLVQRLVWGAYRVEQGSNGGGALLACFRVSTDGSWTDANDDAFAFPEDALIGLPHALEMSAADASAFGQLFADYELLQPFAQIGRDTYAFASDEMATSKLKRWHGKNVPTGRVLGLVNRGWRRGEAQDGGGIWYFTKPLANGRVIELTLDPGIIVGMVDEYPEQTLQEVTNGSSSGWGGTVSAEEPFSAMDPVSASELIRDMEALCA